MVPTNWIDDQTAQNGLILVSKLTVDIVYMEGEKMECLEGVEFSPLNRGSFFRVAFDPVDLGMKMDGQCQVNKTLVSSSSTCFVCLFTNWPYLINKLVNGKRNITFFICE